MSGFAFMRGLFLMVLFPRVISTGRRWWLARRRRAEQNHIGRARTTRNGTRRASSTSVRTVESLPTTPGEFDATAGAGQQAAEEPFEPAKLPDEEDPESYVFDLVFLRWSLVLDGALTTLAAYATQGWHIYLCKASLTDPNSSSPTVC